MVYILTALAVYVYTQPKYVFLIVCHYLNTYLPAVSAVYMYMHRALRSCQTSKPTSRSCGARSHRRTRIRRIRSGGLISTLKRVAVKSGYCRKVWTIYTTYDILYYICYTILCCMYGCMVFNYTLVVYMYTVYNIYIVYIYMSICV